MKIEKNYNMMLHNLLTDKIHQLFPKNVESRPAKDAQAAPATIWPVVDVDAEGDVVVAVVHVAKTSRIPPRVFFRKSHPKPSSYLAREKSHEFKTNNSRAVVINVEGNIIF